MFDNFKVRLARARSEEEHVQRALVELQALLRVKPERDEDEPPDDSETDSSGE